MLGTLIQSEDLFRKRNEGKKQVFGSFKKYEKMVTGSVVKEEDKEVAGCALIQYSAKIWRRIVDTKQNKSPKLYLKFIGPCIILIVE